MNKIIPIAAALALAAGLPAAATAQDHGRGNGGGHDRSGDHGGGPDHGGGEDRGGGQAHGGGRGPDRAPPQAARGRDDHGSRAEVRLTSPHVGEPGRSREDRRDVRIDRRDNGPAVREVERRLEPGPVVFRREHDRGLIDGCPPGLAKKDNGCLPPGQARRLDAERARWDRYDYLWSPRGDANRYRYDDGYVYRLGPQGAPLGYIPVLGGALALGNPWPAQYAFQPVPAYYTDYYGLNDGADYRYADGAVYGLDPRTQAITQVVALLTGQQINVGQPMPAGYDIYNVPYAYRNQYADTPTSLYRYNDGYVYQVDPKTRLVQAVVQLLS